MRYRPLLAIPALLLGLAACSDDSTGPTGTCQPFTNVVAETRGDTIVTTTGLRYVDVVVGNGQAAKACLGASVYYTVELLDGTVLNSSIAGNPYRFVPAVTNDPLGFAHGVVGMQEGGLRRVIAPPELAWGSTGNPDLGVPPNTTVVFELNLLDVLEP